MLYIYKKYGVDYRYVGSRFEKVYLEQHRLYGIYDTDDLSLEYVSGRDILNYISAGGEFGNLSDVNGVPAFKVYGIEKQNYVDIPELNILTYLNSTIIDSKGVSVLLLGTDSKEDISSSMLVHKKGDYYALEMSGRVIRCIRYLYKDYTYHSIKKLLLFDESFSLDKLRDKLKDLLKDKDGRWV